MIICSECGSTVEESEQFCSECGNRVPNITATQPQPITSSQSIQSQPQPAAYAVASPAALPTLDFGGSSTVTTPAQSTSTSNVPKIVLGVVAGAFLLAVIILIAITAGGKSVEKKLDEAIAKKNIFGPSSDNAYALYTQLKNSGASEETLRPYAERLTPLLTESPLKLTKDFPTVGYDEPDVNVWQDAAKNLNWAADLNPANNMLGSRAAYCDGRVAYLQKQSDRALSLWSKAMNLDKSWALPVNGMGLIYLDRKDFVNARSSFSDAIGREPNWAVPYSNMGSTFYQERNRAAAKEFFNKALAKAPNWARPHMHLGNIALEEGDYTTAISEFETALNSNMVGMKGNDFRITQDGLARARRRMPGD